jgi:zinc/manganese transport system permease protein
MQNAYAVASVVAVIGAAVGFFVVLRGLSFASHSLAHIGFAGATGAVLLGFPPLYGLLVFTLTGGTLMGVLGGRLRGRDVAIGMVLSVSLGLGALFLTLYTRFASETFTILFGTVLGVGRDDVWRTGALGLLTLALLAAIYRPLLFSSIDPEVAAARGVPLRWVAVAFFLILAVAVSVAVQVVGVLLVFTLVLAPAATAQQLTVRPRTAIAVAVCLGLAEVWCGVTLAYYIPWPVSFFIAVIAGAAYTAARVLGPRWTGRSRQMAPPSPHDHDHGEHSGL